MDACAQGTSASADDDRAPFFWAPDVAASFPPAFVAFLRENGVHPDNYAVADVPRYVRVSPRASLTRADLEAQLRAPAEPIDWLPGYYRLPSNVKIAGSDAYRSGHLYGIDVSSGAAVAALAPSPGDHVLDLCCAPGAKLCAIADAMGLGGTLTGVDISGERLASCRTLCSKYGIASVRLVQHDGQTFDQPPPRRRDAEAGAAPEPGAEATATENVPCAPAAAAGEASARKRRRHDPPVQGAPFFLGSALLPEPPAASSEAGSSDAASAAPAAAASEGGVPAGSGRARLYDKVLVDAECTHDGSIKHLAKFAQWGWETFEARFLQPERLATLAALQLGLLRQGFRLLRPGGALVYSTCSFARAQNEAIVSSLLAEEPRAALLPIEGLGDAPSHAGSLEHTLRFEPRSSATSGLFIARLGKAEAKAT